jgi:hypothetical protein
MTTAAAATSSSALFFQSTNPGTALGGRRSQQANNSSTTTTANKTSPSATASSSNPTARLFKSDAANNYYYAMKMKNALSNNATNKKISANTTASAAAVSGLAGTSTKEKGDGWGEHKKTTTFATTTTTTTTTDPIGGGTTILARDETNIAVLSSPTSTPTSPSVIPPITSFDQRDILSAASSITHCDSYLLHPNDSFCSIVTTEEQAAAAAAAGSTGNTTGGIADSERTATTTDSKNDRKDGGNISSISNDDPPITEYPSPVGMTSPVDADDDNGTAYDSTCMTYAASAVEGAGVVVPNELKLDAIAEEDDGMASNSNDASRTDTPNKDEEEVEESIEQDLQSYQATASSSSTSTMAKSKADSSKNSSSAVVSTAKNGRGKALPPLPPPPRDEISHARNVVDALSTIGSSAAVSKQQPSPTPSTDKSNASSIGVPTMKLRSVRSMSPLLFKRSGKGEEGTSTTSSMAKGMALLPSGKNANSTTVSSTTGTTTSSSSRANKITMRSVRSMSPSFLNNNSSEKSSTKDDETTKKPTSSDGSVSDGSTAASTTCSAGTDPAAEDVSTERINSSSSSSPAIEKKGTNEKKKMETTNNQTPKSTNRALPPLIPARAIIADPPCLPQQQQQQRIVTMPDDDGSVECSVKVVPSDDKKGITSSASVVACTSGSSLMDQGVIVPNGSTTTSISKTVSDDNGSNESSLFNDLEVDEATTDKPSKMKGRKERAKEKLARRQPKVTAKVKGTDALQNSIPASTSEDNKSNITSIIDNSRKKEKLQKVMNYRKKASPAPTQKLPQKTLDAWLVPRAKQKKVEQQVTEPIETLNTQRNVPDESLSKHDPTMGDVVSDTPNHSSKERVMQKVEGASQARTPKQVEIKAKKTAFAEGTRKQPPPKHPQSNYSKPIAHSSRDMSAPVSRIDVLQTAYSTDTGVSLPPELLDGKKVRIWHESETFDEGESKEDINNNTETLADVFMTCGKPKHDDDVFTYDMNTDVNTIIDERKGWCVNDDESTLNTKQNNVAMCGVDTHQLKKDIIFEVNEVVREVEDGMRRSMRNLFLTCDITQSGGVEAVTSNVANTNDQIFGRAPMPTKQSQPTTTHLTSDGNNTTVKKSTSIFDSAMAARKLSKEATNVAPKKLGQPKKEKPITADEKRNMYVAKLRAAALKHM